MKFEDLRRELEREPDTVPIEQARKWLRWPRQPAISPMRPPSLDAGDALGARSDAADAPGQAESRET